MLPVIDIRNPFFLQQIRTQAPPLDLEKGLCHCMVTWGGLTEPIPLMIWEDQIPGETPNILGAYCHMEEAIHVLNLGKKGNLLSHRGGLQGTIVHEFAHHLQNLGAMNDVGDWYWTDRHDMQDSLFEKWSPILGDFYVASKPKEMTAEVFRVISGSGYSSPEHWEKNELFLEEYTNFLKSNEVFKHFLL